MDTLGSNFSPSLKDVTNLYATEFVDMVPGVSPPERFETITFKGAEKDVRFDDLLGPLSNSANFFCCEGKGNFVVAVYKGANGVLEGKFLDDPTGQDWLELDKWLHPGNFKFRELRSMSRSLHPHVM